MIIHTETHTYETTGRTDILDLTEDAAACVAGSGVRRGLLTVSVPGSTAAVTTIEYEDGALADLREAVERLAPAGAPYHHDRRWGDGNGYAHVRAARLGPALTLPVADARPVLGTWQQVILLDFDNRPRRRSVVFHVMGE